MIDPLRPLVGGAYAHPSAYVDEPSSIGSGTKIWHFVHVMAGARIGADCMLGQGVFVAATVVIGDRVRVQNHVSLYDGVVVEDDVFIGPSAVFTNVKHPRAAFPRNGAYAPTSIAAGCTIGANATIVCGVSLGRFSFVAAGAVVRESVRAHAVVAGVPARSIGWVGRRGLRLRRHGDAGMWLCPESNELYRETTDGLVHVEDDR